MRARRTAGVLAALVLVGAPSGFSYLHFLSGDDLTSALRWRRFPLRYSITLRDAPGVTAVELRDVLERAFNAWRGVDSASLALEFDGFVPGDGARGDGRLTVGFGELGGNVLGVARLLIDLRTGEFVDADIVLALRVPWTARPPQPDRFDLVATTTHEVGHTLGLSHSAVGETVRLPTGGRRVVGAEAIMFPIAFSPGTDSRLVRRDDGVGVSVLYPAAGFTAGTGTLRGRVAKRGAGQQGAHVVAFDLATRTLVGGFTLNPNGEFVIQGLPPGPKVVRVEPLDDADTVSFFSRLFHVDREFRVSFHDRLVFVTPGETARVDLEVAP